MWPDKPVRQAREPSEDCVVETLLSRAMFSHHHE